MKKPFCSLCRLALSIFAVSGLAVALAGTAFAAHVSSVRPPGPAGACTDGASAVPDLPGGSLAGKGGPGRGPADGWTGTTGAPMLASPKFADLDGDGVCEILMTTYGITNPYGEGWLHAWNGAGAELPGFPVHLTGAAPGTAAIGDIDGDGDLEIVQGTWNYVYVFNADGTSFPGWPKAKYVTQAAALADLDGDGDLEIVVPSGASMEVYNHDGTAYPGFPVTGAHDLTAPSVGDIDGDGTLEIVAGSFVASG